MERTDGRTDEQTEHVYSLGVLYSVHSTFCTQYKFTYYNSRLCRWKQFDANIDKTAVSLFIKISFFSLCIDILGPLFNE